MIVTVFRKCIHWFSAASLLAVGSGLYPIPLMSAETDNVQNALITKQCRAGGRLPALTLLTRALAARPQDAELLACVAEVDVLLGRESAAMDAWTKSLTINPHNTVAWRRLRALDQKALATNPGNRPLRLSLIQTIVHTGSEVDIDREIASFLMGASTDEQLELTSILITAGSLDRAQPILIELSKAEPVQPEARAQLGLILMEKADYENAVMELGQAAQARPKESRYALALSEALLRWHHYSTARAFLLAVNGDFGSLPQFQYNLAYSYQSLGERDSAISILTALLKQQPDFAPALFLLGSCYVASGDLFRGEQLLSRAIDADGTRSAYYASLAQVERYQEKLPEAFAALRKGLALNPDDSELIFESALCHENKGELVVAQEQLEKLVTKEPGLVKAHRALTRIYGRMGNRAAAGRERQKLAQLEGKDKTQENTEGNR